MPKPDRRAAWRPWLAALLLFASAASAASGTSATRPENATGVAPSRRTSAVNSYLGHDSATGIYRYVLRLDAGATPGCDSDLDGGGSSCRKWVETYKTLQDTIASCDPQWGCLLAERGGRVFKFDTWQASTLSRVSMSLSADIWNVYMVPSRWGSPPSLWINTSPSSFGICLTDFSYTGLETRLLPHWAGSACKPGVETNLIFPTSIPMMSVISCESWPTVADRAFDRPGCPVTAYDATTPYASRSLRDCASPRLDWYSKEYGYFFFRSPGEERGKCYRYTGCSFNSDLTWCKSATYSGYTSIKSRTCEGVAAPAAQILSGALVLTNLAEDSTSVALDAYDAFSGRYFETPQTGYRVRREESIRTSQKCGEMPPRVGYRAWDGQACFTIANPFRGWFPSGARYESTVVAIDGGPLGGRIWWYERA